MSKFILHKIGHVTVFDLHTYIYRHVVLESEISANAERIINLEREAEECRDESIPQASKKDLFQQVEELRAEWNHLQETAKVKHLRLEQANKAVEFVNNVDEITNWLQEADEILRNDDLGKDVESVQALLKKQNNIETEIIQKEAKLEDLKKTSMKFEKDNHFAHGIMTNKIQNSFDLLEKIQSQADVLKDNLDDSLIYHRYVKDIHDALLWLKEKVIFSYYLFY